jgi:hypothetical protein
MAWPAIAQNSFPGADQCENNQRSARQDDATQHQPGAFNGSVDFILYRIKIIEKRWEGGAFDLLHAVFLFVC